MRKLLIQRCCFAQINTYHFFFFFGINYSQQVKAYGVFILSTKYNNVLTKTTQN